MLILTRKLNESFVIERDDEVVEIHVTELSNGQVRLGITAPDSCKIWRKELYQTVLSNRQAASASTLNLKEVVKSLGTMGKKDEKK